MDRTAITLGHSHVVSCADAALNKSSEADPTVRPAGQNADAWTVWRFLADKPRQGLAQVLVYLYVFLLTFGALQRPFGNPFGFGFSSIVVISIVVLLLPETLRTIRAHRILQLWLFLVVYIYGVTIANGPDSSTLDIGNTRLPSLLTYCLLCAAVASLPWDRSNLRNVGLTMVAGLAIAGTLALVDDFEIANLPLLNISLINEPPLREPVAQFGHRSIMSLYLGVMLPFLFVLEEQDQSRWLRAAIVAVGICFLYFLISSRNRSGFGAIVIALATYYAFHPRHRERWLHPRVPGFVLAIVLALVAVFWLRPWQGMTFVKLWFNSPLFTGIHDAFGLTVADVPQLSLNEAHASNLYRSDMLRVELVEEAFSGLGQHFLGRGFMANTHVHFVVEIIYAAGVVGILWLAAFAYYTADLVRTVVRSGREWASLWLLLTPLIAWFSVGLMYNAIDLGLGWVLSGMLLALYGSVRGSMNSPEKPT